MSPNITLSWVLALAPEIGLLIVLFMVLVFDKLFKPVDRRQVGLFTAWGALAVLLLTAGLYWLFGQPSGEMPFELPFGQTTPDDEATPELRGASGAMVRTVAEDSPAAEAGLQAGDVITAIDGDAVDSPQALVDALAERKPGDAVVLTVTRAEVDDAVEIEATLGEHPDDAQRAYLGVSVSALMRQRSQGSSGGFRLPFDLNQLPFDLDQLPFDLDQLPFDLPVQPQPDGPQA